MMADTSSPYAFASQQTQNPLAALAGLATARNAVLEGDALNNNLLARTAVGDAYRSAIDPVTGAIDTTRLMNSVANDPAAGWLAGDVAAQAQARQQGAQAIQSNQAGIDQARSGIFGAALLPVIAKPNATSADVSTALNSARKAYPTLISDTDVSNALVDAARSKDIHGWAVGKAMGTPFASALLPNALPKPSTVDRGPEDVFVDANTITNPSIVGTRVRKDLAPPEAARPMVIGYDPKTNVPIFARADVAADMPSLGGPGNFGANGGSQPAPGSGAPVTPGSPSAQPAPPTQDQIDQTHARVGAFNDAIDGLLKNPNVQPQNVRSALAGMVQSGVLDLDDAAKAAKGMPSDPTKLGAWLQEHRDQLTAGIAAFGKQYGQPSGGSPSTAAPAAAVGKPIGLPPGASEAAANSAAQYQALKTDVGSPTGLSARLYQLRTALSSLQNTNTGPGTDARQAVASYLNALPGGIGQYIPGVDPNSIKSYDEASKYLTQYASASAGAFGPSTDAKLATALSGNANTHISNLAAVDVVKANIALEQMKRVMAARFDQDAQSQGLVGGNYTDWAKTYANKIDPRAFSADLMSPAQRAKMLSGMSDSEKARYRTGLRDAISTGVINPSDLSPTAAAPAAGGGQ